MWKTILKVCILVGVLAYLIFALTTFNKSGKQQVCTGLDIVVNDDTHFIRENEVRDLLTANKLFPEGKAMQDIDLGELEKVFTASPYIDQALCYKTADGRVTIQVTPRIPVLHVLNQTGEDFYIDHRGGIIPRGYHQIDLIVMTGNVPKQTAGRLYAPMGVTLCKDSFWNHQIEEIHITPAGEIEITPRTGDHIIQLGDTSDLSDKLSRMKTFYTEGLDKAGWNRYKTINLKFKDQVICTRR
ncbi:MAG: hypothetical protein IJ767_03420 [Bacteroidaceae bacterium]|nr:hypothetical protein [Bacteroidaceae bacterium]MBR1800528.1 hypothetical protein [Bacteroidaceae bacterium]